MVKKTNTQRSNKNRVQNVRVVDQDEGTDDIFVQRLLQAYTISQGQTRRVCGYRGELTPTTTASGGTVGFVELAATDDFVSMAAQYVEFRVRAIKFGVFDVQPGSAPTVNFWSTYHADDTTVATGPEDVTDRPDARSIPPGDGRVNLSWVAHGPLEMAFQSTTAYARLGGLSYNTQTNAAQGFVKYQIIAKFIVDFRGPR